MRLALLLPDARRSRGRGRGACAREAARRAVTGDRVLGRRARVAGVPLRARSLGAHARPRVHGLGRRAAAHDCWSRAQGASTAAALAGRRSVPARCSGSAPRCAPKRCCTARSRPLVTTLAIAARRPFGASRPCRLRRVRWSGSCRCWSPTTCSNRRVLGGSLRSSRAAGTAGAAGSEAATRLGEALRTTIGLNYASLGVEALAGGCLAVAFVAAAVMLATGRGRPRYQAELLGAAAVLLLVRIHSGLSFVSGFVPALPVAAFGVVLAWRDARRRILAVIALVALPGVWMLQYTGGAGPQWGGRYVLCTGVPARGRRGSSRPRRCRTGRASPRSRLCVARHARRRSLPRDPHRPGRPRRRHDRRPAR